MTGSYPSSGSSVLELCFGVAFSSLVTDDPNSYGFESWFDLDDDAEAVASVASEGNSLTPSLTTKGDCGGVCCLPSARAPSAGVSLMPESVGQFAPPAFGQIAP